MHHRSRYVYIFIYQQVVWNALASRIADVRNYKFYIFRPTPTLALLIEGPYLCFNRYALTNLFLDVAVFRFTRMPRVLYLVFSRLNLFSFSYVSPVPFSSVYLLHDIGSYLGTWRLEYLVNKPELIPKEIRSFDWPQIDHMCAATSIQGRYSALYRPCLAGSIARHWSSNMATCSTALTALRRRIYKIGRGLGRQSATRTVAFFIPSPYKTRKLTPKSPIRPYVISSACVVCRLDSHSIPSATFILRNIFLSSSIFLLIPVDSARTPS